MKLWETEGKRVKFTLTDGQTITGTPYQYTSDLDNEPYGACIYINSYEILESEIIRIEMMEQ